MPPVNKPQDNRRPKEPTPMEIANIGNFLARARGTVQGLHQRIGQDVTTALAGPSMLADAVQGVLAEAVNSEIGYPQMLAGAAADKAVGAVIQQMLPAVETAVSFGYQPKGAVGQGAGGKKRVRRRKGQPVEEPPQAQGGWEEPYAGIPGEDPPGIPPGGSLMTGISDPGSGPTTVINGLLWRVLPAPGGLSTLVQVQPTPAPPAGHLVTQPPTPGPTYPWPPVPASQPFPPPYVSEPPEGYDTSPPSTLPMPPIKIPCPPSWWFWVPWWPTWPPPPGVNIPPWWWAPVFGQTPFPPPFGVNPPPWWLQITPPPAGSSPPPFGPPTGSQPPAIAPPPAPGQSVPASGPYPPYGQPAPGGPLGGFPPGTSPSAQPPQYQPPPYPPSTVPGPGGPGSPPAPVPGGWPPSPSSPPGLSPPVPPGGTLPSGPPGVVPAPGTNGGSPPEGTGGSGTSGGSCPALTVDVQPAPVTVVVQFEPIINVTSATGTVETGAAPPVSAVGEGGTATASSTSGVIVNVETGAVAGPTEPPAPPDVPDTKGQQTLPVGCLPTGGLIEFLSGMTIRQLLRLLGWTDLIGQWQWQLDLDASVKNSSDIVKSLVMGAGQLGAYLLDSVVAVIRAFQENAPAITGCNNPDVGTAMIANMLIGFIEKYVCKLPDSATTPWHYFSNWTCPVELPSADEAHECWIKGWIDDETWACWTRANGLDQKSATWVRSASMDYPAPGEAISLHAKGLLPDGSFQECWAHSGVKTQAQADAALAGEKWYPSPEEAITWMLKDIADPNVTVTFGLGAEFQQKFTGQVKSVFDGNLVDPAFAANIWAAHWRNMSPTTLYEMHKRLRPGWTDGMSDDYAQKFALSIAPRRPPGFVPPVVPDGYPGTAPVYYFLDDLQSGAVSGRKFLDNLVTSGFQVYEALGQADYPPFWRERLVAISYSVMTRVDMRRAYETGEIDLGTLVNKLQDRGYSPVDSEILASFFRTAQTQLSSRRPAANQWVSTGFDTNLLKKALMDTGMREDQWENVYAILDTRRSIYVQTKCLNWAKKRFLMGLMKEEQVVPYLISIGMDGDQAAGLLKSWKCEALSRPKLESASQVCKYYATGLVDEDEAIQLVRALGYTRIEATRMLRACLLTKPKGWKGAPKTSAIPPLPPPPKGKPPAPIVPPNGEDGGA